MQVEGSRMYRLRDVAGLVEVSVVTVYRASGSAALRASRLGTVKGAVRVPGSAVTEWMRACENAAVPVAGLGVAGGGRP